MSLTVKRLDSIEQADRNQWNHVVEQADLGSVFHRYGWLRAIERGQPLEPRHLLVEKKGNPIAISPNFVGSIGSVPIRRLYSIRPGSGGPIAMGDEEAALDLIFKSTARLCEGTVRFHQIDNLDSPYVRYHDHFLEHGYSLRINNCHMLLDTTHDWETLLIEMDSSRRRAIRRGHDHDGTVVDEELTEEVLSEVHENYTEVAERVGEAVLPRSFFVELATLPERVKVFSLHVNGKRCGLMLFVLDDEQSTVHYLRSAVTEDHFQFNASELIHEYAIKWAIENGYKTYNFRGAEPDFRNGLFRFKERFATRAAPCLTWERGYPRAALAALNGGRVAHQWYTSSTPVAPEAVRERTAEIKSKVVGQIFS
ncbi:lipid II:glycine glycyltransferase FemX [Natronosalvus halobius]|uniref:lipid II:glycine glycyltransferase FemX n=1 Tax=Natronosalvus halobius TaxID=2953746 RepID=UPI0020A222A2|nr:peptidoglycan bridge formation glycyltransferase FemA/FemB family protein [Natronosalvus halobius]USZ72086.1 GNAT family N-acetyltransferase [Natronosalvus halobius]